jgi:hypothetical protein
MSKSIPRVQLFGVLQTHSRRGFGTRIDAHREDNETDDTACIVHELALVGRVRYECAQRRAGKPAVDRQSSFDGVPVIDLASIPLNAYRSKLDVMIDEN